MYNNTTSLFNIKLYFNICVKIRRTNKEMKSSKLEASILRRVKRLPNQALDNNVVYILRSVSDPDLFYCGYTNNIKRRIRQHNGFISGGGEYTSENRPWVLACLIYGEIPLTKAEALKIEYYTKAKNYSDSVKDEIPMDDPVEKRVWLIKSAIEIIDLECNIIVFDSHMKKLF